MRYQFGFRTADFLTCRTCGVYIGAVMSSEHGSFAALNLNTLITPVQLLTPEPVSYDAESRGDRITRREARWTPVVAAV